MMHATPLPSNSTPGNSTPNSWARRSTLLLPVAAVAGLALVATGCGQSASEFVAEKAIEQQTDGEVDVDFSDGGIAIETPEGDMTVDEDGSFTITDQEGETIVGDADEDGSFTVEGEDGSFTMSQDGEIPAEWPSEVPQPAGLSVSGSSVIDSGDGSGITLAGTVEDSEAFMSDYGAALEAAGLDKSSEFTSDEAMSAMFASDTWAMSVGASQFDGQHQVSITIFPQS
jgi:hypothetical protein